MHTNNAYSILTVIQIVVNIEYLIFKAKRLTSGNISHLISEQQMNEKVSKLQCITLLCTVVNNYLICL